MATKKPKNHGKADPVRIQVEVRAKVPKRGGKRALKMTPSLLNEVIAFWAETGEPPEGFEVSAVHWINPSRVNKSLAKWKTATTEAEIEEARTSLHIGRLLQGGANLFSGVRANQGNRKSKASLPGSRQSRNAAPKNDMGGTSSLRPKSGVDKTRPNAARLARDNKSKSRDVTGGANSASMRDGKRSKKGSAKPNANTKRAK